MDEKWKWFDSIRCINLYTREDRYKECSILFGKLGVPVKFFRTHKHPNGGTQGCFESHISCIKEAYEQGCKNCLIFEDDPEESEFLTSDRLQEIISFLETNKDWNLFYLGFMPDITSFSSKHISGNIYNVHGLTTHAYICNRPLMEKLSKLKYNNIPIDQIYLYLPNCYATYPSMFYQKPGVSDIGGDIISGSSNRIQLQQAMEAYYTQVAVPVRLWIFLVLTSLILLSILFMYSFRPEWVILFTIIYFLGMFGILYLIGKVSFI
jgi:GR25 family glycosyltransferase involved in LPS biosynthesis